MTLENFVEDLWHRTRIHDALLRYCRGLDRRDFDLVRSAYHEDAFDDHGEYRGDVPGLIAWMESRHGAVEQCMHVISNCLIERVGDVAAVETYGTAYQRYTVPAGTSENTPTREQVLATVRFVDRFERRADDWRIAHRTVVFEAARIEKVAFDFPPPGWTTHRRDGHDALWDLRRDVLGPDVVTVSADAR